MLTSYLGKLLSNARVVRFLAQHHRDILTEFRKLAEIEAAAAWTVRSYKQAHRHSL